jgi:hypothetical protein
MAWRPNATYALPSITLIDMGITSTEAAWKQSSHKAQHRPQAVKNNGNAPEKAQQFID